MKKVRNEEGENPLLYLIRKTWRYSAGNRRNVLLFWTLFIVSNSITLFVQPLLWARIMNVVTRKGISTSSIKTLAGLLLIILLADIVFWTLHGPGRLLERGNAFRARSNYRKHLLKGIMALPMEWHRDQHSGDSIDKIEKGTTALFSFSDESFEIISAVVQLIGSYGMLIYFSPPSAFIVLVMMFAIVWITMRFDKLLIEQYQELNHAENEVSASVFDAVSNISTVIILRVEQLVFKAIVHKIERPFELFQKSNVLNELKWFITNICCTITTIMVLGVYFWQHIGFTQGVLVGSVYLLITYLSKISLLFFQFTAKYGVLLQQKAKVVNAEELTKDFVTESLINHVLPATWKQLQLQGLSFSYDGEPGSNLHLENITMSILKGERIALIGETGSGKTTFLKVVRDLYHPQSLELTVDGEIVPQGFEGISQAIALVPQNPEIFATTIISNITLGAEYDLDFVRKYTDLACFTEVAENLPQKFETSIKEKGVNLSGGQQQRLALARGLLASHDKDILLLDEPTSSLDTITEMKVYQNILNEFKAKTVISTIHRMHLLPLFDTIYLFDKGRIIGAGTLGGLLSSNAQFQRLLAQ